MNGYKVAIYNVINKQLSFKGYLCKWWRKANAVVILHQTTVEERNIAMYDDVGTAIDDGAEYCDSVKGVCAIDLMYTVETSRG